MDFHKQYRSMNENITPSDTLVQQTIAKMESGRPHRARKPLKIILAVAAALACVSTAVGLHPVRCPPAREMECGHRAVCRAAAMPCASGFSGS